MAHPEADLLPELQEIDLYDPERYRTSSQHPAWARLREQAPMWAQHTPDGDRFWSATRHRDVAAILMDDKRFSSEYGTILAVAKGDIAGGRTINLMDQPHHARVRLPVMRTMSTRVSRERKERVREHVRRAVGDAFSSGEVVDVAAFAIHLPLAAIGDVIGIPRELWPQVPRLAMAGVAPGDPTYSAGGESHTLNNAHLELFSMFSELIQERRRNRRDDVISALLDIDFGGRPLSDHELLLNCYSFAMGAITTTPQVASHLILELCRQPHIWRRLRADPGLVPSAVEEALRWASPTNHLMRRVLAPVRVAGVQLEPGELVCTWVASANRDSAVFDDPDTFDPGRTPNPHLAFGVGAHRCIGGPPAQVVLAVLLEEMLDAVQEMSLAGEVTHMRSNFINGITRLPVLFRPRPGGGAAVGAASMASSR
ncbi:cytochrome P450 [Dactylosporangium sp. NPDC000555]|uniref:cytochrome P450 n=1 Tax=Dactylosporangium sp. NPDC000555 TaxID=3154260 RepID=UPI003330EAA2